MSALQTDPMTMRGPLAPGTRKKYILAGNSVFTVRSLSTGTRFTYRVRKMDGKWPAYFVGLLSGPDNVANYQYLGLLSDNNPRGAAEFKLTSKSRASVDAPSVRAISWLARNWENAQAEVWHEGTCGRCGRRLTVPESIASGIGPTCEGKQ